ncbi:MAG: pyridoxal-phosphate dependent enzyme, partial [Candidatus Eremiobacteraeota bacterium]|nr:pyridoxal-phosphate dependent enzyme [Candidatus Eremiobacteraeota bacterium]
EVPDLDVLLVPLGGGGLLSGCAVATRHLRAATAVFGVEPAAGDDWARSWQAGEAQRIDPPDTIADGLRVTEPGLLTWPVVREFASGVLTVSDDQIRAAMRMLVERLKLVVEPSGAVGLAAALSGLLPKKARRVGIVLSGGNIEIPRLNRLLSDELHVP